MANVLSSPHLFKKANTENGQNTSIKNHKIIFRALLDTQTSLLLFITSTLALAKQVNSDSAEQVHDPHEQIHPHYTAPLSRHVNRTLTGGFQTTALPTCPSHFLKKPCCPSDSLVI